MISSSIILVLLWSRVISTLGNLTNDNEASDPKLLDYDNEASDPKLLDYDKKQRGSDFLRTFPTIRGIRRLSGKQNGSDPSWMAIEELKRLDQEKNQGSDLLSKLRTIEDEQRQKEKQGSDSRLISPSFDNPQHRNEKGPIEKDRWTGRDQRRTNKQGKNDILNLQATEDLKRNVEERDRSDMNSIGDLKSFAGKHSGDDFLRNLQTIEDLKPLDMNKRRYLQQANESSDSANGNLFGCFFFCFDFCLTVDEGSFETETVGIFGWLWNILFTSKRSGDCIRLCPDLCPMNFEVTDSTCICIETAPPSAVPSLAPTPIPTAEPSAQPSAQPLTLLLSGLSPTTFNPPVDSVTVLLTGAEFAVDPSLWDFQINGVAVDTSSLTITANSVVAPEGLVEGSNTIQFQAQTTEAQVLEFSEELWVGTSTLTVNLIDSDASPFLQDSNVEITLADNVNVKAVKATTSGSLVFENLPLRTILIEAATADGLFIGSGGLTMVSSSQSIDITMSGFGSPSDIDNNDFSQGLDGWTISPDDIPSANVVDHVEFPGPPNPLLTDRRRQLFFFDDNLENKDLLLRTDFICNNERSVSRVFDAGEGSTMVHIRYRFQTDEVPGGYFGSQYNDYFSVSLRSLLKGSSESETASMNGLGLGAFDFSSGETRWRDIWLPLDPKGDQVAVDISVANVADCALQSSVYVDFVEVWDCTNEKLQAVLAVGFFDAWEAGKTLASEAKAATAATGLPGSYQGQADAFRHCFWNCRMAQEIDADQAESIGTLHEACNPKATAEDIEMDLDNNAVGRSLATSSSTDCSAACLDALNNNELTVLNPV